MAKMTLDQILSIVARMRQAVGAKDDAELCRIVPFSSGQTSTWKRAERMNVPDNSIHKVASLTGVSFDWIKTGEGPMKNERSVGDGVQIGDSVEAEVIRGGRVIKEDGPTKALLDEAINHLSFIGANDRRAFWRLTNEIKDVYDVIYKSVSKASGTGE